MAANERGVPDLALSVPVLFALAVIGLIVFFRPSHKLIAAAVGLAIVGVASLLYLPLAFILRPFFSWMVILIPLMTIALFYVGMMYLKDAKSVHPLWAIFLGLLRHDRLRHPRPSFSPAGPTAFREAGIRIEGAVHVRRVGEHVHGGLACRKRGKSRKRCPAGRI